MKQVLISLLFLQISAISVNQFAFASPDVSAPHSQKNLNVSAPIDWRTAANDIESREDAPAPKKKNQTDCEKDKDAKIKASEARIIQNADVIKQAMEMGEEVEIHPKSE